MLDELDMQDTAGEAETNSYVMYSYGPPHMAVQKQDDQHEHTFSNYVRIRGCCPEDLPEAMNDREKVAREGQGYPCYQHDMMMMMILSFCGSKQSVSPRLEKVSDDAAAMKRADSKYICPVRKVLR